ncbi:hypothetical protein DH26_gp052 [Chloriridovirus anopheles1]|uniref:Uncharacterized protein n=1 Tax=Chloriridovirus anopheles1 TaxID=1465751 RepID=W8QRD7_9VIRU|nr:hypothetical protein DH26_gp052 [Anopheles minimus iridovirus]AHL67547.1 hypothetical protein AMIV_052 [Anopheles minimus iridovirus]
MSQTTNLSAPAIFVPCHESGAFKQKVALPGQTCGHFESSIANKIGHMPHYPGPISNFGGLRDTQQSWCRIPGVQPFTQTITTKWLKQPNCSKRLTNHCFEYGNTRFPPTCECDEKYDCSTCVKSGWSKKSCGSNCSHTCSTCNHNSNVIFH